MIGAAAHHTDVSLRNDWKRASSDIERERASSELQQRGAARESRPSRDRLHGFWSISSAGARCIALGGRCHSASFGNWKVRAPPPERRVNCKTHNTSSGI
jgi:hypothetical protein